MRTILHPRLVAMALAAALCSCATIREEKTVRSEVVLETLEKVEVPEKRSVSFDCKTQGEGQLACHASLLKVCETRPVTIEKETEVIAREGSVGLRVFEYLAGAAAIGGGVGVIVDAPNVPVNDPETTNPISRVGAYAIGAGLIAAGTALGVLGIVNSARMKDSEGDSKQVRQEGEASGEETCFTGPFTDGAVILRKNSSFEGLPTVNEISAGTDSQGLATFAASSITAAMCPDGGNTKYVVSAKSAETDVTSLVHPLCADANRRASEVAAEEATSKAQREFEVKLEGAKEYLRNEDWLALLDRIETLSKMPASMEQREKVFALERESLEPLLKEAKGLIADWDLDGAEDIATGLSRFNLSPENQEKAEKLKTTILKKRPEYERREARKQAALEKEAQRESIKGMVQLSTVGMTYGGATYGVDLEEAEVVGNRLIATYEVRSFTANLYANGAASAGWEVLELLFSRKMQELAQGNTWVAAVEVRLVTTYAKTDKYGNEIGEKRQLLATAAASGVILRKINLDRATQIMTYKGVPEMFSWLRGFVTKFSVTPGYQ